MSLLTKFHSTFGQGECYARPSAADLEEWTGKTDPALLQEWRESGWCSYAKGTFWFVNPKAFEENTAEWFPDGGSQVYVFARSAFGSLLFALEGGGVRSLHVHWGKYVDLGRNEKTSLQDFINYALTPRYLRVALYGDLAEPAAKKFGRVEADEMFTFEPALALGGAKELKYVRKVKMMPQLSLLSQLCGNVSEVSA